MEPRLAPTTSGLDALSYMMELYEEADRKSDFMSYSKTVRSFESEGEFCTVRTLRDSRCKN